MHFLDLTMPSVAENIALDEALLEEADAGRCPFEILRIWHAHAPFIVLGRSSRYRQEIDFERARNLGLPILRRVSGGASILAAPGCMFYALVLSLEERPELRMLDVAHQFVMNEMTRALAPLVPQIRYGGTCDLVLDEKKVSGNSVRVVRNWMLYHGSLLLDMDLALMDQLLQHPPREPDYRRARGHGEFVTNLRQPIRDVMDALRMGWKAHEALPIIPSQTVHRLIQERYSRDTWNLQR